MRGTEDKGWGNNNKCQGRNYDKASREGGADFCGRSGDPSKRSSFQQRLGGSETDRGEGVSAGEV